jgi:hypothetical protein
MCIHGGAHTHRLTHVSIPTYTHMRTHTIQVIIRKDEHAHKGAHAKSDRRQVDAQQALLSWQQCSHSLRTWKTENMCVFAYVCIIIYSLDNNAASLGNSANGHLNGGKRKHIRRCVHVMHEFEHSQTSKWCVKELGTSEHEVCERAAGRIASCVLAVVCCGVSACERIVGCEKCRDCGELVDCALGCVELVSWFCAYVWSREDACWAMFYKIMTSCYMHMWTLEHICHNKIVRSCACNDTHVHVLAQFLISIFHHFGVGSSNCNFVSFF